MSLIKLAKEKSWVSRHPLMAGGIALTAGIAGADAITGMYKNKLGPILAERKPLMHHFGHNLAEGAVYGAALSAIEPAVLHGALKKKVDHNE